MLDSTTHVRREATHRHHPSSLQARLEERLVVAHKTRTVVRFFEKHRWLLRSKEHGDAARKALTHARLRHARVARQISWLRSEMRVQKLRVLQTASPKEAICVVFRGYCGEAVDVAWCESRLETSARNGEYLGLFQMGSLARRLFGHGPTAWAQAIAAHKYFLNSGRDWSPWSCKPSSAY
jgi:hypothetical protein